MEIIELSQLDPELLSHFLDHRPGEKSIMSELASSQTGNDRVVTKERINYILQSADHIMLVVVQEKHLLGMTIAQKVTGINNSYIYIHDVVVDPDERGSGVGSKLVEKLMDLSAKKWPEAVRFQLTSRPSRGTGPFFQKFDFRPRTKEAGDETVVYVKNIGGYKS